MRPVQADLLADRSAEQLVHRYAQRPGLDVDQRVLDRRNGLLSDAALRGAATRIQPGRDRLIAAGVLSDQDRRQAADHGGHTVTARAFVVFAPADNARVGGDLEEVEVAPDAVGMQRLDAVYLHVVSPMMLSADARCDAGQPDAARPSLKSLGLSCG